MPDESGPSSARVVMVSANAYPVMGGTETHIHEVAPRIARGGFDVSVLTTDRSGRLPAREEQDGVAVRRVRAWPAERDYYVAPGIYSGVTAGRWDLVHCQGYHTAVPIVAMLAALRSGIPYVVTFHSGGHGSRVRTALRPLQHGLLRRLLARARKLIAVSEWESRQFQERLGLPASRFVVIPNGAELTLPRPAAVSRDDSLILSVGRLERYKGHQHAIAAMPHLLRQRHDLRLRIVGSGPFEPELRQQISELGLEKKVEIRGVDARDRSGMAALLAGAGLIVLLSEYESQGIAAMEALALGKRVVVADSTALSELTRFALVRAVSLSAGSDEIAAVILRQLDTPPAGQPALPTWDACAEGLADVYRGVLAVTRPRSP